MEKLNKLRKGLNYLGIHWSRFKNNGIRSVILFILVLSLIAQVYPPLQSFISSQIYLVIAIGTAMLYLIFDSIVTGPQELKKEHSFSVRHTSDLRPFLHTAFEQDIIEIDISAYSGETFYNVFTEFLQGILNGTYQPSRIQFRLMVPDCSANMYVPCEVKTLKEHKAYKKSIQERNKRFANEFAHYFSDIKNRYPDIEVTFGIRMHKFSPLFKIIRLNPNVLFFGIYPIAETPINIGGEHLKIWDFRGERTVMVKIQDELAKEISYWYGVVWNNLSEVVIEL